MENIMRKLALCCCWLIIAGCCGSGNQAGAIDSSLSMPNQVEEAPSPEPVRSERHGPCHGCRHVDSEGMLSALSLEVAAKVASHLRDSDRDGLGRVAVVGAVPLSDLKRETEFGRIMGEYLLTDLADQGLKVTELRLGKQITVLAQTGEFILSRNVGELANIAQAVDYVVVSTFSNTRKSLIVQGRLVNLANGLIETSWRYSMPLNRELRTLFMAPEKPFIIQVKGN